MTCELAGKSRGYGRAEWQQLGVLRTARGAKLRLRAAKDADGVSCCDLLRLAPLSEADLTRRDQGRYETYTVQWEDPTGERPWLESVRIVSTEEDDVRVEVPRPKPGMPGGASVHVARKILPLLGSDGATGLSLEASGSFRVELGDDYGFTLSAAQLRREPFVWLGDLGVFACADGDFASKQAEIAARAAQVEAARKKPFRSTSEQYFELTRVLRDPRRPGADLRSDQAKRPGQHAGHQPRADPRRDDAHTARRRSRQSAGVGSAEPQVRRTVKALFYRS